MDRQITSFCPICRHGTIGHNGRNWVPCGCKNTDKTQKTTQSQSGWRARVREKEKENRRLAEENRVLKGGH